MSHLVRERLYQGPLVAIADVRCRPRHAACGGEEQADAHALVFPRAGVFVRHVRGRDVVAEPNQVLFFNGGEPYRVSHPVPGGDDCTVVAFRGEVLLEALGSYEPAGRERSGSPFRLTHAPAGPDILLARERLRRGLRGLAPAPLEVEESALGLLDRAIRGAHRAQGPAPRARRPGSLRRRRAWVDSTRMLLASRPEANPSLAAIGAAVGCSPFHLAHLFREEVGLPIHRYLLRLRLALALDRIAGGATDLARLAAELGFSSHSHFTVAFRRAFGLPPSRVRGPAPEAAPEPRKKLKARPADLS